MRRYFRSVFGNTWYTPSGAGGRKRTQTNVLVIVYTFGHSVIKRTMRELYGEAIDRHPELGFESPNEKHVTYSEGQVSPSESRGLGFYRAALLVDGTTIDKFTVFGKGRL